MDALDRQLFTLLPAAVGLLVFGLLNVLAGRVRFWWRLAAGGMTTAVGYAVVAAAYNWTAFTDYILVAVATTAVAAAVARISVVANWLRTPLGYGTVALTAAVTLAVGSYLRHEYETELAEARELASLALLNYTPTREEAPEVRLVTDLGHAVTAYRAVDPLPRSQSEQMARETMAGLCPNGVIRRAAADENTNCHGWVFTGGRYIIPNAAVEGILQDNGYESVPTASPGDVVVYRDAAGGVVHTALVRYVAPGRVPMVEGKWGWLGVYLHAADASGYGNQFAFYRSHRDGDLLRGIDGSTGTRLTGAE